MTDTKEILKKIAALRVRLDQVHSEASQSATSESGTATTVLEDQVRAGAWHNTLLDGTLRQLSDTADSSPLLPPKLTARGARVLQRGRDLVHEIRDMLEDPILCADDKGPLSALHAEIASLLDVLLRTVQAFPPSASAQLRLCEGLEAGLRLIEERLAVLNAALGHQRAHVDRLDALTDIFRKLANGQNVDPRHILTVAEEIAREARNNQPLRFMAASAQEPARFAAAHGITVAQVMGRLLQGESEWKDRLDEALLAALLHDVGMARVPAEILATPGPLSDEQRRLMERHTTVGARMITRIMPGGGIFVEGAADHHERMDGTGYPAGKRDSQISGFARMLAVCDVYAALAVPRPQRAAQETRTALTDTLLLADQGRLDRLYAERLLGLSFYPVGSVVELNDGAIGYVIGTQPGRSGIDNPSKPILSLLLGARGQVPAVPSLLDLVEDGRAVVRGLSAAERRKLLLGRYPELI